MPKIHCFARQRKMEQLPPLNYANFQPFFKLFWNSLKNQEPFLILWKILWNQRFKKIFWKNQGDIVSKISYLKDLLPQPRNQKL